MFDLITKYVRQAMNPVKQYRVVGNIIETSCDKCKEMNGRVFDIDEYEEGETAPPFHPNCRCSVEFLDRDGEVVYNEDESGTFDERRFVSGESVNLRREVGSDSDVIEVLSLNEIVYFSGRKEIADGYSWAEVMYNSDEFGWVTGWIADVNLSDEWTKAEEQDDSKDVETTEVVEAFDYIYNQNNASVANMEYGSWIIKENGCELIAVYNALVNLGAPRKFENIIKDAESENVMWLGGSWGTTPGGAGKLLAKYGRSYTSSTNKSQFNSMLSEGGTYILSYWNKWHVFGGIHTVMFTCGANGSIEVYNESSRWKADSFASLDEYLKEQGEPIVLYNVK